MFFDLNENIAILDTETNWQDDVMSIGIVIANADTYEAVDSKYYIFNPEYRFGGKFIDALGAAPVKGEYISREGAMQNIIMWLKEHHVHAIFAYNALFDRTHLNELEDFEWYDIMRIAAYKQYNKKIPASAECYKTGKLKKDYGVEPILRLLSGDNSYYEKHNALSDAIDELKIMALLNLGINTYNCAYLTE